MHFVGRLFIVIFAGQDILSYYLFLLPVTLEFDKFSASIVVHGARILQSNCST